VQEIDYDLEVGSPASSTVLKCFLEACGVEELSTVLDRTLACALDHVLNSEPTEYVVVSHDLLQKRNSCILAHGLMSVGERSAKKFLEYVDAVVARPEVRASGGDTWLGEL
jgi:hypothetical protein